VYFPLSLWDISLWIAVMAIILLVTSELIAPYSDHFGDFVIEKTRLRQVALVLGAAFMVTVILRAVIPP
jgi:site-specific recombinase